MCLEGNSIVRFSDVAGYTHGIAPANMRLLQLRDVEIRSSECVFRHARVRALAIYLIALGGVGWMFFYAFTRGWKIGYLFGSGVLLFLAWMLRMVTARFRLALRSRGNVDPLIHRVLSLLKENQERVIRAKGRKSGVHQCGMPSQFCLVCRQAGDYPSASSPACDVRQFT